MLVLSRKITERLSIGQQIEITVLAIRGGRVRLGIACPEAIPIRRSELPSVHRRGGAKATTTEEPLHEVCLEAVS